MLFRFAESVVNIAHVPKECLYYLRLPIAKASAATVERSSPTSTLPLPCICVDDEIIGWPMFLSILFCKKGCVHVLTKASVLAGFVR
jgi:hypothetical protein